MFCKVQLIKIVECVVKLHVFKYGVIVFIFERLLKSVPSLIFIERWIMQNESSG